MASFDDKKKTSALSGTNAAYLEDLLNQHESGLTPAATEAARKHGPAPVASQTSTGSQQLSVSRLIDAYRLLGNRAARIDPLSIDERPSHPMLDMHEHGLSDNDLAQIYSTDIPNMPEASLSDIIDVMQQTYCNTMSAEFMYITDPAQRQWFIDKYEARRGNPGFDIEQKKFILQRIIAADALESYLNTKYTGQKRFSLEGGDSLIPMLDVLLRNSCKQGIKETCIGMAHRGRLNVLINILGKNPQLLFEEFEGKAHLDEPGSGDVKYHLGFSSNYNFEGNTMHTSLAFNPSHLEIVNPVVEGSVWARQQRREASDGTDVLPILIHGDAALAGQGVGMEVLNMSQTRGYSTGGTVHITVNNQVGFTISDINDARSTYWCTDIAKMAECPVLHVNGNDPEAACFAAELALEYRNTFHQDVFIDLCCYRRHGHNEQDEPRVTQPHMYSKVSKLPNPASYYAQNLVKEGSIDASTEKQMRDEYVNLLKEGKPANPHAAEASISDFIDWAKHNPDKNKWSDKHDTKLTDKQFKKLSKILSTIPENFKLHSRVGKIIEARASMAEGKADVDWGMAENLAYASLVDDDYGVRLSGQDVGRGTFFHRHAVWHDQNRHQRDGHTYVPLANIKDNQPNVYIIDSLLSESAVLGFEYGVSLTNPENLIVWEAQFGDFANNAQVVIDQFIASGEFKWGRYCSLVMLLPHGYEGQGPEHSSARLERYLQLCAEYNICVCVPSTASQIFHLLRRQMLNPLRRPLIVFTPKSLLRNKEVSSPKVEFIKEGFKPVIGETETKKVNPVKVSKVVFCSGKIYYELRKQRDERKAFSIAIVRLEQIYPFPHEDFQAEINKYPEAGIVLWCQEEPGNQGAWHRIQHYIRRNLNSKLELKYSLRRSAASTATGHASLHRSQQQEIIDVALA